MAQKESLCSAFQTSFRSFFGNFTFDDGQTEQVASGYNTKKTECNYYLPDNGFLP